MKRSLARAVIVGCIGLGFGFAALDRAEAQAPQSNRQQAQRKDARCVANFLEACQQRCVRAGGRTGGCPSYCSQRQKELGCS